MFIRKDGHTLGILIDFDLAIIADMPSDNQHRTGTRPFMAMALLQSETPIRRQYKHDAESFFWVVVYNTTSSKSVNGWGLLSYLSTYGAKASYLISRTSTLPMKKEIPPPIVSWVDGVRKFLILQVMTRNDWGIDELYNKLRGFRHDQGESLAQHIKARQERCLAPAAS